MSILLNKDINVIIQGVTGKQGRYHTLKMLESRVKVVGGITPGKGGEMVHGVPVYDTIAEAKKNSSIHASMILVPPLGVLDASLEAIENQIPLIVVITEFVPFHDSLKIKCMATKEGIRVIGPNTNGVINPGECKVGIMPDFLFSPGHVGIISRSGTLTHEVASNLTYRGMGQSTCVGIGGDMIRGTDFVDVLKLFREDRQTQVIIMIGEIGGAGEEMAAKYIKENGYPKKIVAFIAGSNVPAEKRMGHAGAIISEGFGKAETKIKNLSEAGVVIARGLDDILEHCK